jgi:hypothetical protein
LQTPGSERQPAGSPRATGTGAARIEAERSWLLPRMSPEAVSASRGRAQASPHSPHRAPSGSTYEDPPAGL